MAARRGARIVRGAGCVAFTPLLLALGCDAGPATAPSVGGDAGPSTPPDASWYPEVDSGDAGGGSTDGAPPDDPDPTLTDEERATLEALRLAALPAPPADVTNAFADSPAAAAFGQRLFFYGGFSGALLDGDNDGLPGSLGQQGETGKVACASCHVPADAFTDTRTIGGQISLGSAWGSRRAPSLLDVSRSRLLMWDGRRDSLQHQVFGPIEAAVEMNGSRLFAAEQLFRDHRAEYESVFGAMPPLGDAARFPQLTAATAGCERLDADNHCTGPIRGAPGDGGAFDGLTAADQDAVTRVVVNAGKAIAAYERLLSCGTSRFDAWMAGDATALDRSEQRGAALFAGRGKCATCHSGPFFSDEKFHNVGLKPAVVAVAFLDANDEGAAKGLAALAADPLNARGTFSDGDDGRTPDGPLPAHLGAFRTPRLRCVSRRPSFMHTGQYRELDHVVAFFARGGDAAGYPGTNELRTIGFTPRERADVVAFLRSLDGPGPGAALLGP